MISQDERERAIFRSRRKFQTDMQSNLATARDQGRQIERIEIARNALQMGLQIEVIVKLTGLTLEEVEHLRMTGM